MPGRSLKSGLSLAEVLVACALTSLLLGILSLLYQKVFRAAARGSERALLTQQAVTWFRRFIQELESAPCYSLSYHESAVPTPTRVLSIQPLAGYSDAARPVYRTDLLIAYFYSVADQELVRTPYKQPISGITLQAAEPQRIALEPLLLLQRAPAPKRQKLSSIVEWGLGSQVPAPLISDVLNPCLVFQCNDFRGQPLRLKLERQLRPPLSP